MARAPGRPVESTRIYPHQRLAIIEKLGREGTIALIVERSRRAFQNEENAWAALRKGFEAGRDRNKARKS